MKFWKFSTTITALSIPTPVNTATLEIKFQPRVPKKY